MSDKSTGKATGTVRLHRVLKAPPERVYKAFIDPDAMAKWLPPHGFTASAGPAAAPAVKPMLRCSTSTPPWGASTT